MNTITRLRFETHGGRGRWSSKQMYKRDVEKLAERNGTVSGVEGVDEERGQSERRRVHVGSVVAQLHVLALLVRQTAHGTSKVGVLQKQKQQRYSNGRRRPIGENGGGGKYPKFYNNPLPQPHLKCFHNST